MGWNLGGGWEFNREYFRKAFVETCGLNPEKVYLVMMEPAQGLPPFELVYRMLDMTKGPFDIEVFAETPYDEFVGAHPLEASIEPERTTSGMTITGTLRDTYFLRKEQLRTNRLCHGSRRAKTTPLLQKPAYK